MIAEGGAPIRVLVVARQPIARAGLHGLLAGRPGIVVADETSFDDAERRARDRGPDVVLASWDSSVFDAVVALGEALEELDAALLLIGSAPTGAEVHAGLRAGVRGFLLADVTGEDLAMAIGAVHRGLIVLDPMVGRRLASATAVTALEDAVSGQPLTEREIEVLQLLALGLPNKTIASRLQVSEHTVKFHVGSILAKLGATSRTEAVTRAVRRGLLTI